MSGIRYTSSGTTYHQGLRIRGYNLNSEGLGGGGLGGGGSCEARA